MSAPLIRRAVPADLDAIDWLENNVFDGDKLSRRSLRHFITSATTILLVAPADERLDGYALIAFRRNSTVARLFSIAVAPHASGRGLGRRLLGACEDAARARGARMVRLEVRVDNPAAIRLYEAMGYREFDRVAEYYEDGAAAMRFEKPLPHDAGGEPTDRLDKPGGG